MAESVDIYGNGKQLESAISHLKESDLFKDDKKDILSFVETMQAQLQTIR